ncbi:hypothetical protein O159_08460 [Leifsonia xyli subsp. cynodontis DSM 46306]|uniref:Uncharacterized protein n=1 Tax=Leifsonia xyli subsp. cynodontis DSM 46306 TaxID=1389489 RepID=U3P5F7_LEIXC|nr:hypothetical protein O159_08460 [Leifsonia xyli subsp. cynodontis DSM 46306]
MLFLYIFEKVGYFIQGLIVQLLDQAAPCGGMSAVSAMFQCSSKTLSCVDCRKSWILLTFLNSCAGRQCVNLGRGGWPPSMLSRVGAAYEFHHQVLTSPVASSKQGKRIHVLRIQRALPIDAL